MSLDGAEEYLISVVYDKRPGFVPALLRVLLYGLSFVYRGLLWLYLLPFRLGIRPRKCLPRPVISVGNITVGGTGKTPTVDYLCKGLLGRGLKPAVLSYGYGGGMHGRFAVVSDGRRVVLSATEAGDEPVMLASGLPGVPVIVGKHRAKTGQIAIENFGADVVILDDGFQVWKLHRDLDIVLIDAGNPFDNGRTLPAGRLREPVGALCRAQCVLVAGLSAAGLSDGRSRALAEIRKAAPDAHVFLARHQACGLRALADGKPVDLDAIRDRRVVAMSSIANPESFERTLEEVGAVMVGCARFPDHHLYNAVDIEHTDLLARNIRAEFIVTTDKDSVKLKDCLTSVPVLVLSIRMLLDDETGFWQLVSQSTGIREDRQED